MSVNEIKCMSELYDTFWNTFRSYMYELIKIIN